MRVLRNVLERFRRGLPKMDFMNYKHEDCANFDNGTCIAAPRIFNLTNLPPKAQACPHFVARRIEKTKTEIINKLREN